MSIDKLFVLLQMVLQAESNSGNTSLSLTSREFAFATSLPGLRQFMQQQADQGVIDIIDGLYSVSRK
jgi:hypothetical protein